MGKNNCENCGANLLFNPGSGVMECEHCGTTVIIKAPTSKNAKAIVQNSPLQSIYLYNTI